MKRDVYQELSRAYEFDLNVKRRNQKGEVIKEQPKKPEEIQEIEFKNQVYARIFQKMDNEFYEKKGEDEETDDDQDNRNIRDRFID